MTSEKEPVTTIHGEVISIEEALKRREISSIIRRFGTWAVTPYGVECLSTTYTIKFNRVHESDWIPHMKEKVWVSIDDFANALYFARELMEERVNYRKKSGEPLRVFLCHANEDKSTARDLYNQLIALDIQPWLDEKNILPGQDWPLEIKKAVRNSDVIIVLLSQKAVDKTGFIQKEIRMALDAAEERPEGKIFIIPAKIEACSVPDRLSSIQWVDLYIDGGYDRLMNSLRVCAQG